LLFLDLYLIIFAEKQQPGKTVIGLVPILCWSLVPTTFPGEMGQVSLSCRAAPSHLNHGDSACSPSTGQLLLHRAQE
jgi:hypothetical protein